MNKLIKAAGGKASDVLDAMIQGLKNHPKNFEVDMDVYGEFSNEICFGCAATCTVMQISGVTFTPYDIGDRADRAKVIKISEKDLDAFEWAIDSVRRGYMWRLEKLIKIDLPVPIVPLPRLSTLTWEEELPAYEAYRDQLRNLGL
jgi:hypothetical protein